MLENATLWEGVICFMDGRSCFVLMDEIWEVRNASTLVGKEKDEEEVECDAMGIYR